MPVIYFGEDGGFLKMSGIFILKTPVMVLGNVLDIYCYNTFLREYKDLACIHFQVFWRIVESTLLI